MFKKNKNGEETIKVKVVKEKKAKEKKPSKKDKSTVTDIFRCQEIQFKDFRTYCTNHTKNGDWILNLGGENGVIDTHNPEKEIDSKEFMGTYDENLIQVYRHQDESLVSKNVKMIGVDTDPENKGLYSSFMVVSAHIVNKLSDSSLFSTEIIKKFCEEIADIYDRFMVKNEEDQVYGIHIWVPVWRTTSEKGFVVGLLDGRINIIIT